ncbi:hypothetical protein [Sphingopyxis yananensis]|uniref:hypothetical protein n=1 Tax=Sphingopyxis yananensis TaxID=2886687 RepID=UPI001D10722B|nr:hypothetical protein [Sphingopyxis yananensis]MCC2602095.1 hypothetical protein [Sphingopyxis yananensis]
MIKQRLSPLALGTAALSAALLAGCTPPTTSLDDAAPFTPKQLRLVERELGGKVAGEPQKCLPSSRNFDTIRVSDTMLIYRASGKLVYRNDLRGSCPGLARDSDVMVVRQFGSQSCAGDFFHLVDRSSGIRGPTCILGEFTPYRRPDEKGS